MPVHAIHAESLMFESQSRHTHGSMTFISLSADFTKRKAYTPVLFYFLDTLISCKSSYNP